MYVCSMERGNVVGSGAHAFAGGDEEIVAVNGEGGGIPVGGDEAERRDLFRDPHSSTVTYFTDS